MSTNDTAPGEGRPLSHAQHLIWTGQKLAPTAPLYNMAIAVTIEGELDVSAFRRALESTVEGSDALRTVFLEEDGVARRIVQDHVAHQLAFHEYSDEPDPEHASREFCAARARINFDLSTCLFESALLRLAPDRHVWWFNQHHLITDAWSTGVIYRHVSEAYREACRGVRPPTRQIPSYEGFVEFQASQAGRHLADKARTYWRTRLADAPPPPSLYGTVRRHPSTETTRTSLSLGAERSARIRKLVEQTDLRGLTPHLSLFNFFATLLTAWMWRCSGQDQLGLGCPALNRTLPVFKETTGEFIEIFPVFANLESEESFRSLNSKIRDDSIQLMQHSQPGASLPEFGRHFNVVLNYITATLGDFDGRPVKTDWVHCGHGDSGHHFRLQVEDFAEDGEFVFHFDFNDAVFPGRQQEFAIAHILRLLDGFLEDPAAAIASLELPGAEERQALEGARGDSQDAPVDAGSSLPAEFRRQARATPQLLAVSAQGQSLTYAELDAWTDRLALWLRGQGAGKDKVVALCTGRSVNMIAGMLAILKAGAAYLPLSPADPVERLHLLLDESNPAALLTEAEAAPPLANTSLPMLILEGPAQEFEGLAEVSAPGDPSPGDLAYILFTSGSTGLPKAVMIEHRNVLNLVGGLHERIYLGHGEALQIALVAPYVFDPSVQQIFATLLLGHTLHLVPEEDRLDGQRLREFFAKHRIDVADGTPGHLRLMVESPESGPLFESLQHLVIGGEAMPKALMKRFFKRCGESPPRLTNVYGPAECCVDCVSWEVTPDNLTRHDTVPIGTALPGEQAYVLDEHDHLQPIGVTGELCLAGAGVGRGYLGDEALTRERFGEDPNQPGVRFYRTGDLARMNAEGLLEFVGRRDNQVKIRGYRIELGEVEAALKAIRINRTPLLVEEATEPIRCRKCLLTDRHPGVTIAADGTCSICQNFEQAGTGILGFFRPFDEFESLVERCRRTRRGEYDCMLLYSGGKDSSYVLHRLADMGLKILAYTFDNGHISAAAFRNIEQQTSKLGVESVVTRADRMDEIFVDSLNTDSTVCSGCFKALTTISTRLAEDRGINLVLTGLSRGQIFDTKLAGLMREGISEVEEIEENLRLFRQAYHANNDRAARLLEIDLSDVALDRMEFVDFFRYDSTPIPEIQRYLKERDEYWRKPQDTGFCSSNCLMNDIGICVHSDQEGYHNYEAPLSWDIRLGIVERDEGMEEVRPVRNMKRINSVLSRIGFLHREIQDVAVIDREDEEGSRQLSAYYVSAQPFTVQELRTHLAKSLPAYMVPASFVRVDEIPLTPNGKVDRRALEPSAERPDLGQEAAPAGNTNERILLDIWQAVLQLDKIGIHDNFFELGGDSIRAIQIVSRAATAGLRLTPGQLLAHQTIAELAELAEEADTAHAEQGPVSGPVDLTPVQRWFFDCEFANPDYFHQSVLVSVPESMTVASLGRALRDLTTQHDMLRAHFRREESGWSACLEREPAAALVEEGTLAELEDIENRLHRRIEIGAGPLMAAALLTGGDGERQLLWAIHHLAVDAVSWPVLLSDLAELLEGRELPRRTTSFQRWARGLAEGAGNIKADTVKYWSDSVIGSAKIPRDHPGEVGTVAVAQSTTVRLTIEETEKLLHELPRERRLQPNEAILAALAGSLREWTGNSRVAITLEGHGREELVPHVDITRTVGWFTSRFPFWVELGAGATGELARTVKEALRAIPDRGASYGSLRYLHPDATTREAFEAHSEPEVLFNYLGNIDTLVPEGAPFHLVRPLGLEIAPENNRPALIDVSAMVVDGRLEVVWGYSPEAHHAKTIEEQADSFAATLRGILTGEESGQPDLSASDFPHADLDADKLSKLSKALGKLK